MRIDARGSDDVRATIQALKGLDRQVRTAIRVYTRAMARGEWQQLIREHVNTKVQMRVLADSARVNVSDQNITLRAATSRRALKGGLRPAELGKGFEFGANTEKVASVSGRGGRYRRHTARQMPVRRKTGHAVWPAAADYIPRIAALWVQTVVRTLHEVIEER